MGVLLLAVGAGIGLPEAGELVSGIDHGQAVTAAVADELADKCQILTDRVVAVGEAGRVELEAGTERVVELTGAPPDQVGDGQALGVALAKLPEHLEQAS